MAAVEAGDVRRRGPLAIAVVTLVADLEDAP
jgi:hypothetical protein